MELINYIVEEWETVKSAPLIFITACFMVGGIVFAITRWGYGRKADTLKERLNAANDEIVRLKARLQEKTDVARQSKDEAPVKNAVKGEAGKAKAKEEDYENEGAVEQLQDEKSQREKEVLKEASSKADTVQETESEDDHKTYTKDRIFGSDWQWDWQYDGAIINLVPLCPNCSYQPDLERYKYGSLHAEKIGLKIECKKCGFERGWQDNPKNVLKEVRKEIQRRVRTGEYKAPEESLNEPLLQSDAAVELNLVQAVIWSDWGEYKLWLAIEVRGLRKAARLKASDCTSWVSIPDDKEMAPTVKVKVTNLRLVSKDGPFVTESTQFDFSGPGDIRILASIPLDISLAEIEVWHEYK